MGNSREDDQTQLYRHFDAAGRLLYVGISLSVLDRLAGHRRGSKWFAKIAKVTVVTFGTKREALYAEAIAIRDERPKFNKDRPDPARFAPPPVIPPCFSCGDEFPHCMGFSPRRCEKRQRTDPLEYAKGMEHFSFQRKQRDAETRAQAPLGPLFPSSAGGTR